MCAWRCVLSVLDTRFSYRCRQDLLSSSIFPLLMRFEQQHSCFYSFSLFRSRAHWRSPFLWLPRSTRSLSSLSLSYLDFLYFRSFNALANKNNRISHSAFHIWGYLVVVLERVLFFSCTLWNHAVHLLKRNLDEKLTNEHIHLVSYHFKWINSFERVHNQ